MKNMSKDKNMVDKSVIKAASDLVALGAKMKCPPDKWLDELSLMATMYITARFDTLGAIYGAAALMIQEGLDRGATDLKDMVQCFCSKCEGTNCDAKAFVNRQFQHYNREHGTNLPPPYEAPETVEPIPSSKLN